MYPHIAVAILAASARVSDVSALDEGNCYGCQDNPARAYLGMAGEDSGQECVRNLRHGIKFCFLTYDRARGAFVCIEQDPNPCGFNGPMRGSDVEAEQFAGCSDGPVASAP
jgi:hypothetical protein